MEDISVVQEHKLKNDTLYREKEGIIGYCICGWNTGTRFSGFVASALMQEHIKNKHNSNPCCDNYPLCECFL